MYHILRRPAPVLSDPAVRELTLDDLGLLDAAGVDGDSFGDLSVLLTEGLVAAAVISGKIVATAQTGALTERYADIGVETDAEWRRRDSRL